MPGSWKLCDKQSRRATSAIKPHGKKAPGQGWKTSCSSSAWRNRGGRREKVKMFQDAGVL
jgi:hypothetical protein